MKRRLIILGADFAANGIVGQLEHDYQLLTDIASVDVPRGTIEISVESYITTYNDDVFVGSTPADITVTADGGLICTVGEPTGNIYPITIDGSAATSEECTITVTQPASNKVITIPATATAYAIKASTNAPVMAVCYAQGWAANADYMTFDEAAAVTTFDTAFKGNTEIISFDEARFFTSVNNGQVGMFEGCTNLKSIDLSGIEVLTSNAQSYQAARYFYGCSSLQSVKLPAIVKKQINQIFEGCTLLSEIDLQDVTFVEIGIAVSTFAKTGIVSLDLGDKDFSVCTSINWLCKDCVNLKSITLPTNIAATNCYGCFEGCAALESLDASMLVDGTDFQFFLEGTTNLRYVNFGEGFGRNASLKSLFGYKTSRALIACQGWLDMSKTNDYGYFWATMPNLRKLEIRNAGSVESLTTFGNQYATPQWGVNSDEVPDAEESVKNTMRYLFDRASAGYSNLTIALSANTKAILTADATLLAGVVAKGYTIA